MGLISTKRGTYGIFAVFCGVLSPCLAFAVDPNPPTIHSDRGAWPIRRQWTTAETEHYAKWVENLYTLKTTGTVEQRTAKIERLITDPQINLLEDPSFAGEGANPQLPTSILRQMNSIMDCGKFTAFIPAYYAYRRALPWMTAVVRSTGGDVRTTDATVPVGNTNSFTCGSVSQFFSLAVGSFISGNYRVPINGKNAELSDTVPVALTPDYLLPGVMNYLDGHCLILAHISKYGELHFLNCSTTETRDIFTYNAMNTVSGVTPRGSNPDDEWAGCFQGLRVPRYPIAITNSSGKVIEVRRRTDDEMKEFGFSTEQYDVMHDMYSAQTIKVGDIQVHSYHDLIRLRMMTVDKIVPLEFMEEYAKEILAAYQFREDFVQDAWRDVQAHGPIVFPEERSNENIFQAFGRWETWSSPSSDVDRRNKYFYLADWMDYAVRMFGIKPSFVDLKGLEKYHIKSQADLADALVAEKNRIFGEHAMTYTKSNGEKVRLTLHDIEDRLYDMSFDPNHPPELRWGSPEGSEERASAPQTYTPTPSGVKVAMEDGYRLQAYYRTIGQRETDESYFRQMFTEGYPLRAKLDKQLDKWHYATDTLLADAKEPAPARTAPLRPVPSERPMAIPAPPAPEPTPVTRVTAKPEFRLPDGVDPGPGSQRRPATRSGAKRGR